MARTQLTVLSAPRNVLTAISAPNTAPDVANGNFFINDGFTTILALNADSNPHTITVQVEAGVDGLVAGPRVFTVAVSGLRQWTGVFPIQFYGKTVLFNVDSTQVSVQAVSLQSP